jgi:hypothetical protein
MCLHLQSRPRLMRQYLLLRDRGLLWKTLRNKGILIHIRVTHPLLHLTLKMYGLQLALLRNSLRSNATRHSTNSSTTSLLLLVFPLRRHPRRIRLLHRETRGRLLLKVLHRLLRESRRRLLLPCHPERRTRRRHVSRLSRPIREPVGRRL